MSTLLKDMFLKIKAAFDETTVAPAAPVIPAAPAALATNTTFKTKDGKTVTVLLADPAATAPQVGDGVTIDGMPATEGVIELEDGSTITADATGVITAISDAPTMADPATTDLSQIPPAPTVEERLASIEAELVRMKQPAMPAGMATEVQLQAASQKIDKQEATIKAMFSLLELLVTEPSADPVTLPDNKADSFASKKEQRLIAFAESVKAMKNKPLKS